MFVDIEDRSSDAELQRMNGAVILKTKMKCFNVCFKLIESKFKSQCLHFLIKVQVICVCQVKNSILSNKPVLSLLFSLLLFFKALRIFTDLVKLEQFCLGIYFQVFN